MDNLLTLKKIIISGTLDETIDYTLKDLFAIRAALGILADYDLADLVLLKEVNLYIEQKIIEIEEGEA